MALARRKSRLRSMFTEATSALLPAGPNWLVSRTPDHVIGGGVCPPVEQLENPLPTNNAAFRNAALLKMDRSSQVGSSEGTCHSKCSSRTHILYEGLWEWARS
jgi:hypothetical protein